MTTSSLLVSVYDQLTDFANLSNFWSLFNTAFGSSYDSAKAATLRSQWQSGNFSQSPKIEVISSNVLGSANGAYSASTNKIYLSDRFVATAGRVSLESVLLEAFGHFVDAQVNSSDSTGDEGAIFAALVLGQTLDTETLLTLKAEDDHATITVNGQVIQVELQDFIGTNGRDNIVGTPGDDSIIGRGGNDSIDGGAGNDYIFGGNDTIFGGAGNDTIFDGEDTIFGGAGNDFIDGGSDDDTIFGGADNDVIYGGFGNDSIDGGAGNDGILGGLGNDLLVGGDGDDNFIGSQGNDVIKGDSGFNTANYTSIRVGQIFAGKGITLKPFGVVEKDGFLGTDSLVNIQKIIASNEFNDTIDASTTVVPSTGITVNLATNSLTVKGSGSPFPLNLQVFDFESVIGTKFDDTITGNIFNNLFIGGEGNDIIDGGIGRDSLVGGDGDDTFIGSKGDDKVNGDSGSNTADYSLLGQAITLKPFGVVEKAGKFGTDSLVKIQKIIASNLPDDTIDASTTPAPSTGITANLATGTLTVKGSGSPLPLKFNVSNFENVIGTNFDDTITGDSGNNRLIGNTGKDTLTGGAGNDFLEGGDGNDSLTGGGGNDSLIGGLGADKFVFTSLAQGGIDVIQDFSIAEGDKVQINAARFSATPLNQFNYNSLSGNLSLGGSVFVTLENKPSDFTIGLGIQFIL